MDFQEYPYQPYYFIVEPGRTEEENEQEADRNRKGKKKKNGKNNNQMKTPSWTIAISCKRWMRLRLNLAVIKSINGKSRTAPITWRNCLPTMIPNRIGAQKTSEQQYPTRTAPRTRRQMWPASSKRVEHCFNCRANALVRLHDPHHLNWNGTQTGTQIRSTTTENIENSTKQRKTTKYVQQKPSGTAKLNKNIKRRTKLKRSCRKPSRWIGTRIEQNYRRELLPLHTFEDKKNFAGSW